MGYGYEVKGPNDRKVQAAVKLVQVVSESTLLDNLLLNNLPFLRHIPEWLSWFSYKPLACYGYNIGQEVLHDLIEFVRESILNGTAQPSLALEHLHETKNLEEPECRKAEDLIANALGTMYFAGTDTTAHTLLTFFVVALLHPDAQKLAQKELDMVTGRERLPTFEDRSKLPFVEAICTELMRWKPVAPLGVPVTITRDNVYNGFFIPKDVVVITNIWAILHDPTTYPKPDSFKLEQFINPDGSFHDDPVMTSVFGFGKWICPGRHLADAMIFIVVASLLSVFNIKKDDGTDEGPDVYPFIGKGISRPCPFTCSITARDKRAEELILGHPQAL